MNRHGERIDGKNRMHEVYALGIKKPSAFDRGLSLRNERT